MNAKKILTAALAACLCLALTACSDGGPAVYVQSAADLSAMGGIAPGDRFAGIVVSENVTEIRKDEDKAVAEILVREGDDVTEGQALFSYDTEQLQLSLDKQQLELEQLRAAIEGYTGQIADLEKDREKAKEADKLAYTVQIQTLQVDLKEAELNLAAKEKEVEQSAAILENAVVTSPVTGRIQSISENGMDNYGNPLPYISIQQVGSYRIKGSLNELQRGGIYEGLRLRIVSRTDASVFWTGTVTLVDYENPSQGSGNEMYYGVAMEETLSSSKYPFYVEPDSTEGLLLGQHVYMEQENAGEETAFSVPSAFVAYDDAGAPFVWAEVKGRLEKRTLTLGEYDPMTDTFAVAEGLTASDYIAFPDPEICREGASTTHDYAEDIPEAEGEVK